MKHLKLFESSESIKKYWVLPLDSIKLEIGLRKLNCTEEFIKYMLETDKKINGSKDFICVRYNNHYTEKNLFNGWYWNSFNYKIPDDYYSGEGYSFGGYVETSEAEIKAKITANKYNL
jgi:hypothetical protein